MTTKSNPSNPITMKINRNANTIELQWDRKSTSIEYVLNNLKLFDIETTSKITKQILNLSSIGGKKSNADVVFI